MKCTTTILAAVILLTGCAQSPADKIEAANKATHSAMPNRVAHPRTQPATNWRYDSILDSMTSKSAYTAEVSSTNFVNFSFPYAGDQHGTLMIRNHPREGLDALFFVQKGQIQCSSGRDNCQFVLRIDNDPPQTIDGFTSGDNDATTVFLAHQNVLIHRLSEAKIARLEVTFFQQGSRIFEFNVGNFDGTKIGLQHTWSYEPATIGRGATMAILWSRDVSPNSEATILVMPLNDGSISVEISLNGHSACGDESFECQLSFKFDSDQPVKMSAMTVPNQSFGLASSIDNHDASRFLSRLLTAKTVQLNSRVTKGTAQVFNFDVDGLDRLKVEPPSPR